MATARVRSRTRQRTTTESVTKDLQIKSKGDVVDEESSTIKEAVDIGQLANPSYVRVGGGITKNMGDFNSIRVNVEISRPCLPNENAERATKEALSELVEEMLSEELKLAEGGK